MIRSRVKNKSAYLGYLVFNSFKGYYAQLLRALLRVA